MSGSTSKYRFKNKAEIDILYENDMIEVKKLDRALPYQSRWLVNSKVNKDLPDRRRVLLTNDKNERVMFISEYDALVDLLNHRVETGNNDNMDIIRDMENASREKLEVYCLNMTKYLVETTSKEG